MMQCVMSDIKLTIFLVNSLNWIFHKFFLIFNETDSHVIIIEIN
jgi:hypothetical protein